MAGRGVLRRLRRFLWAYGRSMRPYYGFVTLAAGWAGASVAPDPAPGRVGIVCAILYLGWGVNQVINDATNRREDAVNAPRRPMVTGELPVVPAVTLSAAVIAAAVGWCAWFAPWAAVPILAGVALNVLYSSLKGHGLWGNLTFGCSIACCAWFGYVACGGEPLAVFIPPLFGHSRPSSSSWYNELDTWFERCQPFWVAALVVLVNAVMTTFTYFKDEPGDRAAGKRTVVVAWGPSGAGRFLAVAAFLPALAFGPVGCGIIHERNIFFYLAVAGMAAVLFVICGIRYLHGPGGAEAERGLGTVFAATVLAEMAPVAMRWSWGALAGLVCAAMAAFLYALTEEGRPQSVTGPAKGVLYGRVAFSVLWRYRRRLSFRLVRRAAILLLAFRHDKPVRCGAGWKLHLYLPAWPSPAFFRAVEDKLFADPPCPVSVVLSTTPACTFHCPHCYQRRDGGSDLPLPDLLETVAALDRAGVAFLNVEGGDCFLDFERLLALCRAAPPTMEVWVNTTGAQVTAERLAVLKAAGMTGIMVSMHGATAAAHDAFTGVAGTFEGARAALRMAVEAGIGTAVNAVLSLEEIQSGGLEGILREAGALGCGYVQLIHPKRAGLWVGNTALDMTETRLVMTVLDAHRRINGILHAPGPALAAQAAEETDRTFGCTAGGIDRFYIGASGEVQPCEFVNLSFGNLREEPFETLFARMREAFPVPREAWLCRAVAPLVAAWLADHPGAHTPLPPEATRTILAQLPDSPPTRIYRKMGLYRS